LRHGRAGCHCGGSGGATDPEQTAAAPELTPWALPSRQASLTPAEAKAKIEKYKREAENAVLDKVMTKREAVNKEVRAIAAPEP